MSATGLITAGTLNVTANSTSALNTAIGTLNANITGPSSTLTVTEADSLTIGSGNVKTTNGQISITTSGGGSLVRTGSINAGTANVALTLAGGTTGTGLVTGNALTLNAVGNSSINTTVNSIVANVSGPSNSLGVFQTGKDLTVAAGAVRTNNGSLTLDVATPNNLTVSGPINIGSATATLNATGGFVNATGLITAGTLNVTANSTSALNTAIGTLNANISGASQSLTVNQAGNLSAGPANIAANGNIALTLTAGSLNGTGSITSVTGDVSINASAGAINPTGRISGSLLTMRAANASTVFTNVAQLSANITSLGQSLTVNESNGLLIAANGIVTNSGAVTIASTIGGISGTGQIRAGSANVTLNTPNGGITLGSSANQIVGNVLTLTALNSSVVNTSINALDASITGTGSLTVNEADNLIVSQARTANGAITLTTSTNSTVNITSISAATGVNGNLTVINGSLWIDAPGIVATNTVDLRQVQSVWLLGGNINAPTILLPNNAALNYLVTSSADSGTGTVRDVINRINAAGGKNNSTIQVLTSTSVALVSALPVMRVQMNVNGNGFLTLDGSGADSTASGFTITSTLGRSTISGVTLKNFGGAGIDFVGAQNISVTGVSVTDSRFGFRASGVVTGSGVFSSTFINNVIGGMLSQAQGLSVGGVSLANTFTGGTGFRGASTTGISASGTSTGTIVKANAFNGYPTAISLVAATGVTVGGLGAGEGNSILNAVTAGIYASGFCNYSFVYKTQFPSGSGAVAASKQYLVSTSRNLTISK